MRAPFNRTMNVFSGPALGGGARFVNIPCRYVLRDESGGISPSPPFHGWVTSPIASLLIGSQTSDISNFDLTRGDRLYDVPTGNLLGIVLWTEIWLPGSPTKYQRAYVCNPASSEDTWLELGLDLEYEEIPTPTPPTEMALALDLTEEVNPLISEDGELDIALDLTEEINPPLPIDTKLDLALDLNYTIGSGSGSGSGNPDCFEGAEYIPNTKLETHLIAGTGISWYKITTPALGAYAFHITKLVTGGGVWRIWSGPDCDHLVFFQDGFISVGCIDVGVASITNVYIQFIATPTDEVKVQWELATGPC